MRGQNAVNQVARQAVENLNLPRNASKGDWGCLSLRQLFQLLLHEVLELAAALLKVRRARRRLAKLQRFQTKWGGGVEMLAEVSQAAEGLKKARQHARHEAGDIVAFSAMIFERI